MLFESFDTSRDSSKHAGLLGHAHVVHLYLPTETTPTLVSNHSILLN